ncbi:MAG: hypothetical protein IIB21_01055 [Chloroflexi bacterium]|nr:hypothetical protein [Chloroflexota bacterium]
MLPLLAIVAFVALASQVRDTQAGLASYALDDTAPFAWVDISGTGTLLTDISDDDDEYQSDVPIGFTFNFAGTDYTALEPTSNGVISLDQEENDEYDNNEDGPLPTSEWEDAALFPWWDDLYTEDDDGAGDIFAETLGTAPNRIFIIQYDAVTHYDSEDEAYVITFQAVLCETSNNIVFQYLDTVFGDPSESQNDNGGDATIGIQESDSSALQYSFKSASLSDNMAIVFYPTSGSPTNCLAGPPPTPASPPAAPTDPPEAPQPTDPPLTPQPTSTLTSEVAAVTLPKTGAGAQGSGSLTGWLIAALLSSAGLAAAGYGALHLRPNRRP